MKSRSKYRNQPITVDGIRFDSKAEARRYAELKLLEKAGEIAGLELQPRYALHSYGGEKVGAYVADFRYVVPGNGTVVEDVKGAETQLFKWKRRHFEAEYHIPLTIIR